MPNQYGKLRGNFLFHFLYHPKKGWKIGGQIIQDCDLSFWGSFLFSTRQHGLFFSFKCIFRCIAGDDDSDNSTFKRGSAMFWFLSFFFKFLHDDGFYGKRRIFSVWEPLSPFFSSLVAKRATWALDLIRNVVASTQIYVFVPG